MCMYIFIVRRLQKHYNNNDNNNSTTNNNNNNNRRMSSTGIVICDLYRIEPQPRGVHYYRRFAI